MSGLARQVLCWCSGRGTFVSRQSLRAKQVSTSDDADTTRCVRFRRADTPKVNVAYCSQEARTRTGMSQLEKFAEASTCGRDEYRNQILFID
jgi:hypothetical protein